MPEPNASPLRQNAWAASRLVRETIERSSFQAYVTSLSNLSDAVRPSAPALLGLAGVDGHPRA